MERTIAWLVGFRYLQIRYGRHADYLQAVLASGLRPDLRPLPQALMKPPTMLRAPLCRLNALVADDPVSGPWEQRSS